jgi:hypothetical protein
MKRESLGPILSTVFVDYDNVYLSLKRKSEEAAKRFSKDAARWIKAIETGRLLTPTNSAEVDRPRRIAINRCYGNPVPRRNQNDNSTDMTSFPFVRHHFLRAGCEVIDCPPLTALLKNSADIRIVMDVRDILTHDTWFDEFVILSGDADFTPVLHRLRSHARRTVIYSNDNTAAPYTAICDAEIRESDLITLLLEGQLGSRENDHPDIPALPNASTIETLRKHILNEVVTAVRSSEQPLPLEALADRAVRTLGYDKTVGSAWGGMGSFRDLLAKGLPDEIRLTTQPPYCVYDATRSAPGETRNRIETRRPEASRQEPAMSPPLQRTLPPLLGTPQPAQRTAAPQSGPPAQVQRGSQAPAQSEALSGQPGLPRYQPAPAPQRPAEGPTAIQQSIARIHEASQAPTLSPPDYRALFDVMAQEISANGPAGMQTVTNIVKRAQDMGLEVRIEDARFVLDVVGESDPWFVQGVSATLFAGRFRNFVVARCRSQGLNLSADELDLIEAWFAGPGATQRANAQGSASAGSQAAAAPAAQKAPAPQPAASPLTAGPDMRSERWWNEEGRGGPPGEQGQPAAGQSPAGDEFPRIIRTRLRG